MRLGVVTKQGFPVQGGETHHNRLFPLLKVCSNWSDVPNLVTAWLMNYRENYMGLTPDNSAFILLQSSFSERGNYFLNFIPSFRP